MPEDLTTEDREFDPAAEPESSAAWLNLLTDAEKKFRYWQEKADGIDKVFSDLERWASDARDRQFAMFWANYQVLAPSVYARPPVPVAVPMFRDRDPIKRTASELLERSLTQAFQQEDIDGAMQLLRDDLLIPGRGVVWVRKEAAKDGKPERCCIEFVDRKDFRHAPARNWREVEWVGRRAWLTRKEIKTRFGKTASEDALGQLSYTVQGDSGKDSQPQESSDPQEKAEVWEIWHKSLNKVVWVSEGVETLLDSGKPHHDLEGFFPCPKPAYSTVERRSLIPVPDFVYCRDQLEEINKLTARIHALSDAIQVKGFYPGGGEIGDAVEAALNIMDDRKVMIPVSNFAAFGGSGDPIVWLPIDMIATTIAGLIEMRRQIIDDVYQILGISDIMRGATESDETLGAQQLKSQYGSIRIRQKQQELVRIARDVARIVAEIMAENFSKDTLLEMSQMSLPTRAEIGQQIKQIEQAVQQQAAELQKQIQSPEAQQMAQQDPEGAEQALQQLQEQAEQALQQAQAEVDELEATPTIDDVMELLRDQRTRPFALDIETDSTIQPDEDAEKQRRAEFLGVLGPLMAQLGELINAKPESAPFAGEILKFGTAPYRVGRQLESAIDEFVEKLEESAAQPQQQESPEAIKAKADAEKTQAEMQMRQQEMEQKGQLELQKMQFEQDIKREEAEAKREEIMMTADREERRLSAEMLRDQQKHGQEMEVIRANLQKTQFEIAALGVKAQASQQEASLKQREADQKADLAERGAQRDDQRALQQAELAERAAKAKEQGSGAPNR